MSERTYRVPRWLDAPEKILVFTIDEFIAFLAIAAAGIMFASIWLAIPLAISTAVVLRRFKGGERAGVLMHLIYAIAPDSMMRWRAIPPSHEIHLAG